MVKRGEDMKLFARYSNVNESFDLKTLVAYGSFAILILHADEKVIEAPWTVLMVAALAGAAYLISRFLDGCGLCVEGEEIYYKFGLKFKFKIEKVVGIKFSKSLQYYRHLGYQTIHDEAGNPYYSMIFVKDITVGMREFAEGDAAFYKKFKKYIVEWVSYEPAIVEWLCQKKPDLVLMYPPEEE